MHILYFISCFQHTYFAYLFLTNFFQRNINIFKVLHLDTICFRQFAKDVILHLPFLLHSKDNKLKMYNMKSHNSGLGNWHLHAKQNVSICSIKKDGTCFTAQNIIIESQNH